MKYTYKYLVLILVSLLLGASPSYAGPTFGGTNLVVPVLGANYTFTWYYSNSASPQRSDIYRNTTGGGTYFLTVTGLVATPSLATVTGARVVAINGYLQNGVYHDKVQVATSGISLTFNGKAYTSVATTTTNVVSLAAGTVTATATQVYSGQGTLYVAEDGKVTGTETGYFVNGTWYLNNQVASSANLTLPSGNVYTSYVYYTNYIKDASGQVVPVVTETYSGNGKSFSIATDGTLSGSESGCVVNGMWYVNYAHDTESIDYTSPQGTHYISRTLLTSYVPDGNGGVSSSVSEAYSTLASYSGPYYGSFIVDPNGRITGSETGYKINDTWYINGNSSTPMSGHSSLNLIGNTYTFSHSNASYGFDSQNNPTSTQWTDYFSSPAYDPAQITYSWAAGDAQPIRRISGSDLYAGSFSADYTGDINNLVWEARTAPTFAQTTLYLNGTLLNWQSGSLSNAGVVTDTYGPDSNGHIVTINGLPRDYQSFIQVQVGINGANVGSFSRSTSFVITGWDVEENAPNRNSPLFCPATLWVDGTPYTFSYGYEDFSSHRTDMYVTSGGTLRLSGIRWNTTNVNVQLNHNGEIHDGVVNVSTNGGFSVAGVDITAVPPEAGPPAFWVGDLFYRRTAGSNQYVSFPTPGNTLKLGGANASLVQIAGMQGGNELTGVFNLTTGLFTLSQQDGTLLNVCAAQNDGRQIPAGIAPNDFPPAIHVGAEVWGYLGSMRDDGAPTATAAYYGNTRLSIYTADPAAAPDYHQQLLKIRLDNSGVVTLTDYRAGTSTTGTYNKQSHLFQTGTTASLPMPIYAVDPNANDTPWQLPSPPSGGNNVPGSGPATLLVGNQVWRYAGVGNDGAALYQGYFPGQQLALGTPNAGGVRTISVTDPVNGNATGILSDVNGSTTLGNGQTINSGTPSGGQVQPQNLATVSGDLSVPGNILSIGSLNGDTTKSGAILQFSDSGTQAMFGTALGRTAAQWVWWRVDPANATGFVPTMVVDSAFGLALYDPANPSTPTVKLSADANTASELPKLKLTNQTLDDPTSVVTQALGDERYWRVSGSNIAIGAGGGVSIGLGANAENYSVSIGQGSSAVQSTISIGLGTASSGLNSMALGFASMALGEKSITAGYGSITTQRGGIAMGEAAYSTQVGQVVLGSFNLPPVGTDTPAASDSIFIIGNGTAHTARSNAFVIKRNGDTQVFGTLTVGGHTVLTQDAADDLYIRVDQIGGGGNSAVLTQDAADTRYIQKGQVLRVAPAGDIDMGEFKTLPPGVPDPTAP